MQFLNFPTKTGRAATGSNVANLAGGSAVYGKIRLLGSALKPANGERQLLLSLGHSSGTPVNLTVQQSAFGLSITFAGATAGNFAVASITDADWYAVYIERANGNITARVITAGGTVLATVSSLNSFSGTFTGAVSFGGASTTDYVKGGLGSIALYSAALASGSQYTESGDGDSNLLARWPMTDDLGATITASVGGQNMTLGSTDHVWTFDSLTTVTRTVKESGGDYTSLAAWEAANQGDLVSANRKARAQIEGTWTAADTAGCVVDGWTTDATRYAEIEAVGSARAAYPWSTTAYRMETTDGGYAGNVNSRLVAYTRWIGLQIKQTNVTQPNDARTVIYLGKANMVMECYIKLVNAGIVDVASGAGSVGITTNNDYPESPFLIRNTVVEGDGSTQGGRGLRIEYNDRQGHVSNCTILSLDKGIVAISGGQNNVRNTVWWDCATPFQVTESTTLWSHNAAASAPPGSNGVTLGASPFTSGITPGSALKDVGTSLSGDATYPFSVDFAGTARPQGDGWDIGAIERVASDVNVSFAATAPAPTLAVVVDFVPGGQQADPAAVAANPGSWHVVGTGSTVEADLVAAVSVGGDGIESGDNPQDSYIEFTLESMLTASGDEVAYTYGKRAANEPTANVRVQLRSPDGSTLVREWTHSDVGVWPQAGLQDIADLNVSGAHRVRLIGDLT